MESEVISPSIYAGKHDLCNELVERHHVPRQLVFAGSVQMLVDPGVFDTYVTSLVAFQLKEGYLTFEQVLASGYAAQPIGPEAGAAMHLFAAGLGFFKNIDYESQTVEIEVRPEIFSNEIVEKIKNDYPIFKSFMRPYLDVAAKKHQETDEQLPGKYIDTMHRLLGLEFTPSFE